MGNGIKIPTDLPEATEVINRYAADERTEFIYIDHADLRSHERELSRTWIQEVLTRGTAVEVEVRKGRKIQHRYKVRYTDQYGRTDVITVVSAPYKLTIITVMRND
jgi:hypothetical protein